MIQNKNLTPTPLIPGRTGGRGWFRPLQVQLVLGRSNPRPVSDESSRGKDPVASLQLLLSTDPPVQTSSTPEKETIVLKKKTLNEDIPKLSEGT